MPCNPFTDDGYFNAIERMVECVKRGVAELVLMGITPTYPSEKYGYVVPIANSGNEIYKEVARFTEKPTQEVAVEHLNEMPMYEEKCWGTYKVVEKTIYPDGIHTLIKSIELKSGKNISYQLHHHRDKTRSGHLFTEKEM